MPIIEETGYRPDFVFRNNHVNTIYPHFFRKSPFLPFERERIQTPDGDFFDTDWLGKTRSEKLVILLHGLEGSSDSQYVMGTAHVLLNAGYSIAAINFRSCSGTLNRGMKLYHSGFTEDLEYFLQQYGQKYQHIFICGFSLGGSVTLNYLGRRQALSRVAITAAAGISVPCDLLGGSLRLQKWYNYMYEKKFLISLIQKIKALHRMHPLSIDLSNMRKIRTLMDFDDVCTAPIHGFKDSRDYYQQCSSLSVLDKIEVPTLLINALDDSFLSDTSFPYDIAESNRNLHLITPRYGGHVGFTTMTKGPKWYETRILEFFNAQINQKID